MTDGPEIDDILGELKKTNKRVNSSRKGKRGERHVCQILSDHFQVPFVKRPDEFGSGAWSTNNSTVMENLDLDHMAGDIITPKGFRFCIENKCGYDIELINLFPVAHRKRDLTLIKEFIEQAERDAGRVRKEPLILYKKDNCPILSLIPSRLEHMEIKIEPVIRYLNYTFMGLQSLLSYPREFFFQPVV